MKPLQKGDLSPEFEALDQEGNLVRLTDCLAKGPVVLLFYPRAMTKGCTAEACHFRDLGAELAKFGALRLGISTDSVERQETFSAKHGLDFPLLSDPDRGIAAAFGVKRPGPLFNRRVTFVIGTDRIIIETIASETSMDAHGDGALAALRSQVS